jgi:hypothetical protein
VTVGLLSIIIPLPCHRPHNSSQRLYVARQKNVHAVQRIARRAYQDWPRGGPGESRAKGLYTDRGRRWRAQCRALMRRLSPARGVSHMKRPGSLSPQGSCHERTYRNSSRNDADLRHRLDLRTCALKHGSGSPKSARWRGLHDPADRRNTDADLLRDLLFRHTCFARAMSSAHFARAVGAALCSDLRPWPLCPRVDAQA